uniref:Ig-like domain-containing protein n=1 Tax=Buteo japonicus TaxID=224669 RepID=A0A8C0ATM5_9AVES
ATYLHVPLVGAFLVHVASSCPLANNGSALDFDFTLVFNKNPLVCYEPDARRFTPARGIARGVLQSTLHGDFAGSNTPTLRKASDGAFHVGTTPSTSVLLTCHVWGFYPAEVTVSWLHNGNVVGPGDHPPTSAIPNGDWTYQTQVTLMVAPTAGDTFACSVQHASLEEPLLEEWSESGGTGTPTRTSGSSPRPFSPPPPRVLGQWPGVTRTLLTPSTPSCRLHSPPRRHLPRR